jgi:hypothetical protein
MRAMKRVSQIETELNEARADLHQTLAKVHEKIEQSMTPLRADFEFMGHWPFAACFLAAALGFVAGSGGDKRLSSDASPHRVFVPVAVVRSSGGMRRLFDAIMMSALAYAMRKWRANHANERGKGHGQ